MEANAMQHLSGLREESYGAIQFDPITVLTRTLQKKSMELSKMK